MMAAALVALLSPAGAAAQGIGGVLSEAMRRFGVKG